MKAYNEDVRGLYIFYLKPKSASLQELRDCGYDTVVLSCENTKHNKLVDYFDKLITE